MSENNKKLPLISQREAALYNGSACQRKKVLPEEEYISKLEKILERDFFSDLEKMDLQIEFLSAYNNINTSNDAFVVDINVMSSARKLAEYYKHEDSRQEILASGNTSLTDFLSKNSSEDNTSFDRLLEKMNSERRAKYAWVYRSTVPLSHRDLSTICNIQKDPFFIKNGHNDKQLSLLSSMEADNKLSYVSPMFNPSGKNALMHVPEPASSCGSQSNRPLLNISNTRMEHTFGQPVSFYSGRFFTFIY